MNIIATKWVLFPIYTLSTCFFSTTFRWCSVLHISVIKIINRLYTYFCDNKKPYIKNGKMNLPYRWTEKFWRQKPNLYPGFNLENQYMFIWNTRRVFCYTRQRQREFFEYALTFYFPLRKQTQSSFCVHDSVTNGAGTTD